MRRKVIADRVARWFIAGRGSPVTDPDIEKALKREGFRKVRGFWTKVFNHDPEQRPDFEEVWRAEMDYQGKLYFRSRWKDRPSWSGALRKDMWPKSLLRYAGRGNQVVRKDKDLMRDTGGISKGRDREPTKKPPRDDNKSRYKEKRLDKDQKKDRDDDDREVTKTNRRKSSTDEVIEIVVNDGKNTAESQMGEILEEAARFIRRLNRYGVKAEYQWTPAWGRRRSSSVHPLDRTEQGAWAGLELPEGNYYRQVYSALWGILESENGVSEKDFARQDRIKSVCEEEIRSPQAEELIVRFEKQGCRPAYCAECIYDAMRRR